MRLCCCHKYLCRENTVCFQQTRLVFRRNYSLVSLIGLSASCCTHVPPLCDLPEYRWCWGAEHPPGQQPSQTGGREGGKRGENDKHEHGGSWGQPKIAQEGGERRGERWRVCRRGDEENIGWVIFSRFKNELFCSQNRKKCFYSWVHVPFSQIKHGLF